MNIAVGLANNVLLLNILVPGHFVKWLFLSSLINLISYSDLGHFVSFKNAIVNQQNNIQHILFGNMIYRVFIASIILILYVQFFSSYDAMLIVLCILFKALQSIADYYLQFGLNNNRYYENYYSNLFSSISILLFLAIIYYKNYNIRFDHILFLFYFFNLAYRTLFVLKYISKLKPHLVYFQKIQRTDLTNSAPRLFTPFMSFIIYKVIEHYFVGVTADSVGFLVKIGLLLVGFINIFFNVRWRQLHIINIKQIFLSAVSMLVILISSIILNYIGLIKIGATLSFIVSVLIATLIFVQSQLWLKSRTT